MCNQVEKDSSYGKSSSISNLLCPSTFDLSYSDALPCPKIELYFFLMNVLLQLAASSQSARVPWSHS